MKKLMYGVLFSVLAFSLFCGISSCGSGWNYKYQTQVQACTTQGDPNFVLDASGSKVPNPTCTGYSGSTCLCQRPPSDWKVQNGIYYCFDPKKAEKYGCKNL